LRSLTSTQLSNLAAEQTRPIFLVEWAHSGTTEYLSCSGTVTYGGQTYYGAGGASPDIYGVNITRLEGSKAAQLQMPATSTRITQVQNGSWRAQSCIIRAIPGLPGDSGTYSASPDEGILILDGIIETSALNGEVVTVTAKSKYYQGEIFPSFQLSDVASHIPAVGNAFEYNGNVYTHDQWYKTVAELQKLFRPGVDPTVIRPSISKANEVAPAQQKSGYQIVTGEGVYLPVVYGRKDVPGYVIANTEATNGDRIIAVAWCLGEVYQIEKVFVGDEELPAEVTMQHYRGTTWQEFNPGLATFIDGYTDDLVYTLPDGSGSVGVAYTIFNFGTNAVTNLQGFRAIIQGRLVTDDDAAANSDPFYDDTQLSVDFTAGTTDASQNAHTVTISTGAGISSPSIGLESGGSPAVYATVSDDATLEVGSGSFTLEMRASTSQFSTSPTGTMTLVSKTGGSPDTKGYRVDAVGPDLYLYLSSDGSTWDIANGIDIGTYISDSSSPTGSPWGSPVNSEFVFTMERIENTISTTINGQQRNVFGIGAQASPVPSPIRESILDNTADLCIGHLNGTQVWEGTIKNIRLTTGVYRYGGVHDTNTEPYADSGTYSSNLVYSNKPALAWKDFAEDPVIGMGATTTNVSEAVAYGDELLTMTCSPAEPRCRIGLALATPKRKEEYLDILCLYASCIWFPEGENLKIVPDSAADAEKPFGDEIVEDGAFVGSPASSWTAGAGWTLGGSPAGASYTPTSPLSQSPQTNLLSQTLTTVEDAYYSISFDIVTESSESPLTYGVSLSFGGSTVITTQTAAGTYYAKAQASSTSTELLITADTQFNGSIDNVSVRRSYYPITEWMRSSLSIQGLSDTNVPEGVKVNYTVPSDTSGSWKQDSFTVVTVSSVL